MIGETQQSRLWIRVVHHEGQPQPPFNHCQALLRRPPFKPWRPHPSAEDEGRGTEHPPEVSGLTREQKTCWETWAHTQFLFVHRHSVATPISKCRHTHTHNDPLFKLDSVTSNKEVAGLIPSCCEAEHVALVNPIKHQTWGKVKAWGDNLMFGVWSLSPLPFGNASFRVSS